MPGTYNNVQYYKGNHDFWKSNFVLLENIAWTVKDLIDTVINSQAHCPVPTIMYNIIKEIMTFAKVNFVLLENIA